MFRHRYRRERSSGPRPRPSRGRWIRQFTAVTPERVVLAAIRGIFSGATMWLLHSLVPQSMLIHLVQLFDQVLSYILRLGR